MRARTGRPEPFWSKTEKRFVVSVSLGVDERGQRQRRRLAGPRGDTSEDARLGLRDRAEQERAKYAPRKPRQRIHARLTLADYLDQWMSGKRETLSPGSVTDYTWAIESHIKPILGTTRLRDIERPKIRKFIEARTTFRQGRKAESHYGTTRCVARRNR